MLRFFLSRCVFTFLKSETENKYIEKLLRKSFQIGNYPSYLSSILQTDGKERREKAVSANERRAEIMRIMVARRQENMQVLASELGVSDRTIRNDIVALTAEYPLETYRGNGGGVRIAEWYHPHKNIMSQEQISVLEQLMEKADDAQKKVLDQMLREYGSNKYRPAV